MAIYFSVRQVFRTSSFKLANINHLNHFHGEIKATLRDIITFKSTSYRWPCFSVLRVFSLNPDLKSTET